MTPTCASLITRYADPRFMSRACPESSFVKFPCPFLGLFPWLASWIRCVGEPRTSPNSRLVLALEKKRKRRIQDTMNSCSDLPVILPTVWVLGVLFKK